MSIDRMSSSPNRAAQDRISALESMVKRVNTANGLLRQELADRIGERDRARATAVAYEQQLAEIDAELHELEQRYRSALDSEWTSERDAAMDAVYDCTTTVEVITDVIGEAP